VLLDDLLQAGIFFMLVLAIGQLFVPGRSGAKTLFFALFCVCSFWVAHAFSYRIGLVDQYPHWNKLHVPLLCMTGPLWFLYCQALASEFTWRINHFRHGIPVCICTALSIPFYFQAAEYKQSHFENNIYDVPGATIYLATRIAELTVIGYLVGSILHWSTVRRQIHASSTKYVSVNADNMQSNISIPITIAMQALSVISLLAACTRLLGSVFDEHGHSVYSVLIPCLLIVAVAVAYFILGCRYPELLHVSNLRFEPHRRTVKRPCTESEKEALSRYRNQIILSQLHLDPNLKLRTVARKIGVPTKRLSEIINTVSNTNFSGFINSMRIEHAATLLLNQQSLSILEVSEKSGFNSKSVFYKQFSHFKSCSPKRYRMRHQHATETALRSVSSCN